MNTVRRYTGLQQEKIAHCLMLATLLLAFVAALIWSWRKWADVLVDFGRELYIPWQLVQGRVLYRDLAHLFGPLSQYFNALLFRFFGVSYTVLFVTNIVLLVLFLIGLYSFLTRATNRLTAFVCCLVAISLFFFSQYTDVANYNFVSPYAHEATHGVILSFLMIFLLWQAALSGRQPYLLGAGIVFGLVLLTKVEVAVAAALTAVFFLSLLRRLGEVKSTSRHTVLFIAVSIIPSLLCVLYFASVMSLQDAVLALAGPWLLLAHPEITGNLFYQVSSGLVAWPQNLRSIVIGTLVLVIPLSFGIYLPGKLQPHTRSISYIGAIFVLLFVVLFGDVSLTHALPVLDLLSIVLLSVAFFRSTPAERTQSLLPLLMWAIFSFALLLKIAFNARIYHYGFYLALPSVITLLVMLTWFLPGQLDKNSVRPTAGLLPVLIVIATLGIGYVNLSNTIYAKKTYSIGDGSDRLMTFVPKVDSRGPIVAKTITWLQKNLDDEDTLTVLPEGVLLNYLTRHANPGRYTNFMPPELSAFGEDRMLQDLKNKPPNYVILVHKDTAEYGVGLFGQDKTYGQQIMNWIRETYTPVIVFGEPPLVNDEFGIEVLRL